MRKKIFIGYAEKDSISATPVTQKLLELGFDVWDGNHSLKGSNSNPWNAKVIDSICTCDFCVIFISEASIQSDLVLRELSLAHKNKRKIISIKLDNVQIPFKQLTEIQWIDTENSDWFLRLLIALGHSSHSNAFMPDSGHSDASVFQPNTGVNINGNATKNIIITGDNNKANQDNRTGGVYFAEKVNIKGDVVGGNQTKSKK